MTKEKVLKCNKSHSYKGLFVKKQAHMCINALVNAFGIASALVPLLAKGFCHYKKIKNCCINQK